jgi:glycosyltransferase involved in cell wall biosynthesis
MDLNLVSSQHSENVFKTNGYQQKDPTTGQIVKEGKLEKPIEILFEGADLSKYFKSDKLTDFDVYDDLKTIKEDFCYLFVGHWLSGDFGEDRKNVGYMLKAFLEVFKNKKNKPALILKTSHGATSIIDRDKILRKIEDIRKTVSGNNLPNVYLIHGDLYDEEINCLYNHPKVKAMVNLTKGEGFGRPLLEFSIIGKPIIASGWSGHLDFLTPELCGLVGGTLTNVHQSAHTPNLLLKESQWFKPDDNQVGHAFLDIFDNYKKYQEKAKELSTRNKRTFSLKNMDDKMGELLAKYVPEFTKVVELKLPTLKKINND